MPLYMMLYDRNSFTRALAEGILNVGRVFHLTSRGDRDVRACGAKGRIASRTLGTTGSRHLPSVDTSLSFDCLNSKCL